MSAYEDPIVALSKGHIEEGSKSFSAAARLLPDDVRDSTYMLYAWCRYCDDAVDGQELGSSHRVENKTRNASDVVETLRRETLAATRGEPNGPVFEALSRVVAKHGIPERYPLELIEGFAMDVSGRRYETLTDTILYCYHVAGVVGLMMARVMGVNDVPTLQRAVDLGIAFQLTNIARDVMDDASANRVYLPLNWLNQAGVPLHAIEDPAHRGGVFDVTQRLLAEADRYYDSAFYGIAALPFRAALSIAAARSVYRAIGGKVNARGKQAWDRRAVVSKPYKVGALLMAPFHVAGARTKSVVRDPSRDGLWTHPELVV